MQQGFTTVRPLKWMIPALVAIISFAACNSGATKTDTPAADSSLKTDSGASKMATATDTLKAAKDSLQPIDTTVTHRPEDRVIKKP